MNRREISLIEPDEKLEAAFLEMAKEFSAAGDDRYESAIEDFSAYFGRLKHLARGKDLPAHLVPADEFWLVSGGGRRRRRVLGRSKLRHRLNSSLEYEGGHIGYDIRPAERRKGYGTMILELTLERAKGLGLRRVLLTCDEDNTGSARVIEKNGGVPGGRAISRQSGKPILRYWIEI